MAGQSFGSKIRKSDERPPSTGIGKSSPRSGRGFVVRIILLAATVWLALPSFVGAQRITIGYSSVTSVFLPFWMGKETGLYNKEGLDVQLV
jgi:ABC-type nitrate/sulfonate/bicarbonate transport system substrate-binding protein